MMVIWSNAYASELSASARKVKTAYDAFTELPSERNVQIAYLEAFPNDFETFLAVFMPKDYKQLYDGQEYVYALFDIGKVLPEQTLKLMMQIETTGKWDADAPNYLQHITINLGKMYPKEFVDSLTELSSLDQKGVINFLVDGPHRPTKSYQKLTDLLKKLGYLGIAKQLRRAGEKARLTSGH